MSTLAEIISRLESGETGREIDADIECIVRGVDFEPARRRMMAREEGWVRAGHYTTSLDAARALVPEGYGWGVSDAGRFFKAVALRRSVTRDQIAHVAEHASAPAALCIAALKARAA